MGTQIGIGVGPCYGQSVLSLRSGLISYWKLDEAAGATRLDSITTTANNLTDVNNVGQAVGRLNNAASFVAASSQRLTKTDNASLRVGGTSFSLAMWTNLTTKVSIQALINKDDGGSSREYHIWYDNGVDGFTFRVFVDGTGATVKTISFTGPISTGVWYFIVAWFDIVAQTLNIQVNGGTVQTLSSVAGTFDGTANFFLGAQNGAANFLNGLLDGVGLWKRVLTSAERASLYNGGVGVDYPF